MNIKMFYHSLYSDWNHGNAHFLRGIVTEMLKAGDEVEVFEPIGNWSLQNLKKDMDGQFLGEFKDYYPQLRATLYDPATINLEKELAHTDLVLVHEWNDPDFVAKLGNYRNEHDHLRVLFHDTHHRSATRPEEMKKYHLKHYDGVLVFGEVIKKIYQKEGWAEKVWTWHEAADTNLFKPLKEKPEGDLVWVGNWGDNERAEELEEFLINPVKELGLKARIYGVRYPKKALKKLEEAGIEYGGYLPNYKVPETFAKYKVTVHVPRRPYTEKLPGIPTIRPFEALACGIPLVSSPWQDSEELFRKGEDYLMANDGSEMKAQLEMLLKDPSFADQISKNGQETIREKHTCAIRLRELRSICEKELGMLKSDFKFSEPLLK